MVGIVEAFVIMTMWSFVLIFIVAILLQPMNVGIRGHLIAWVILVVISACIYMPWALDPRNEYGECHEALLESVNLISMGDSTLGTGSMYIGSGTYEERDYYVYYYEVGGGGIKLGRVLADSATIYEDRSEGGVREMIGMTKCNSYGECESCQLSLLNTYHFHVPPGSVERKFQIDLE